MLKQLTTVRRQGAVRVPARIREQLGLRRGDPVSLEVSGTSLVVRPAARPGARTGAFRRVINRAEDRFDRRVARQRLRDLNDNDLVPWDQIKTDLGL
ncbi:MAG: AbrB/MazE/SpoVT family DNA-binding domain-containing protein [Dehalococcoidia bacterium]